MDQGRSFSSHDALVECQDVTICHADQPIFRHLSLRIPKGGITAIMGPSGTGKTTLLQVICGQLLPTEGTVYCFGQCVPRLRRHELMALRRQMGMVFQQGGLFTDLNVFENVAFPLRQHTRLSELFIHDVVLMLLQAVGLRGARDLAVNQLSGGMAKRVALARALSLSPRLMLYDEPFAGQDPVNRAILLRLIKSINEALGLTSIIVSHDVEETATLADQVYLLHEGRVIASGTPASVFQHQDPAVAQFVRGDADGVLSLHYPAVPYDQDLSLC